MSIFSVLGKIAKVAAPIASFIPGVGPLAGAALGVAGKVAGGGGAPASGGESGGGFWDTASKIGSAASGIYDSLQKGKMDQATLDRYKSQAAYDQGMLDLNKNKLTEDTRQFDSTMGLNRDKLAEDQRQWDQKFGLDQSKFDKEKETEQFGRAQNARYAKVRSPLIGNLLMGKTIADDPAAQQRFARIGG